MSIPVFIIDTNVLIAGHFTGNPHSPIVQIVGRMLNGRIIYSNSLCRLRASQNSAMIRRNPRHTTGAHFCQNKSA